MSMICTLKQISPRVLDELKKKPKLVKQLVESEPSGLEELLAQMGVDSSDPDAILEFVSTNPRLKHLTGYFEGFVLPALGPRRKRKKQIDFNDNQATSLCIEKDWQALHFALTGSEWANGHSLDRVIMSGAEIGNKRDFAYGSPHYLTPEEVGETAHLLESVNEDEIKQRLATASMKTEIYSFGGNQEDTEDVLGHFQAIRQHYADAAAKGNAMLIYIV